MDSQWDTKAEQHSYLILTILRQIIRSVDIHSKKLLRTHGLTGPQLLVLRELERDQSQTIGDLSRHMCLSQATVTSILDRLEKQGYLSRVTNKTDKRKVNLELSKKALDLLAVHPNLLHKDFMDRFTRLDEWEQTLLLSSLQRIASMMRIDDVDQGSEIEERNLEDISRDIINLLNERN